MTDPDWLTDNLIDDLIDGPDADSLETEHMPHGRSLRIAARRRYERIHRRQSLLEIIPEPPAPGEAIHVIGTGRHDFWTFVPQMLDWLGRTDRLYCSTWTTSRANVTELIELWDTGRIGDLAMLTGIYFKRRETAVYATLLEAIRQRGGRYRAFKNHAKVLLMANPERDIWLSVEGSANLTANPRLEQYVFANIPDLYRFHRDWMEECLTAR